MEPRLSFITLGVSDFQRSLKFYRDGLGFPQSSASKDEVGSEVLALAAAAGATITNPAQDTFWGGHGGYFSDPDGHLWEIVWNPFFLTGDKMKDEAGYVCDACGEEIVVPVDLSAGSSQDYVWVVVTE